MQEDKIDPHMKFDVISTASTNNLDSLDIYLLNIQKETCTIFAYGTRGEKYGIALGHHFLLTTLMSTCSKSQNILSEILFYLCNGKREI